MDPIATEPKGSHTTGQDGFTLIEVMIAMVVFTFGILAVLSMQGTSIQGNRSAQNISEAANFGASKAEELITTPYSNVSNETQKKGKYNINQGVTLNPDTTKSVKITVTWSDGSQTHEVDFDFVKSKDL